MKRTDTNKPTPQIASDYQLSQQAVDVMYLPTPQPQDIQAYPLPENKSVTTRLTRWTVRTKVGESLELPRVDMPRSYWTVSLIRLAHDGTESTLASFSTEGDSEDQEIPHTFTDFPPLVWSDRRVLLRIESTGHPGPLTIYSRLDAANQ